MTNRYDKVNFLARGKHFEDFWKKYLSNDKQIKYVMGLGFDPRAMNCFTIIRNCIKPQNMDCKIIKYAGETNLDPLLQQTLSRNTELLTEVIPESEWSDESIVMTDTGKDVSLAASKSVQPDELNGYTDIILDINAMPASVYFPITRNILDWIDKNKIKAPDGKRINFHVVVSENSKLDGAIRGINIDENVTFMSKLSTKLQSQANPEQGKVWIPLLGEDQGTQLENVHKQVPGLVEFCPFFPMPSADPYRCKNLLMEHRKFLIDVLETSSKDYVYSNEMNPFEVCKKIYDIAKLYYDLFKPLGGCKVVISPLSSKLMCVGALLAICGLLAEGSEAGVVHVMARGYKVAENINLDSESKKSTPHSIWLAGECYA